MPQGSCNYFNLYAAVLFHYTSYKPCQAVYKYGSVRSTIFRNSSLPSHSSVERSISGLNNFLGFCFFRLMPLMSNVVCREQPQRRQNNRNYAEKQGYVFILAFLSPFPMIITEIKISNLGSMYCCKFILLFSFPLYFPLNDKAYDC